MNEKQKKKLTAYGGMLLLAVLSLSLQLALCNWAVGKLKGLTTMLTQRSRSEIYMTPSQIEQIREIGQWEFLTINDEEVVDTTRRGLFSDDHLVRIYYGTLRLGIDLNSLSANDLSVRNDSLIVRLPDIKLLDDNIIDEARTKSFHESGPWTGKHRNELYERARQKMIARGLTDANLDYTRRIADRQVRQVLNAMGIDKVAIEFE